MTHRGFALLFALLVLGCGTAFAQSKTDADQLYGQGVHAFNSRQYAEAVHCFDQIETLDVQDPRAFFFRGLAHARLGDIAAANTDYATAARLELTVAGRSYSVPKALERIQGRERTAIEQHRRAAKRAWDAEQNQRRQDEFLAQKTENQKLYQSIIASGETVVEPPPAPEIAEFSLPFGAKPIMPFAESKSALQSKAASGASGNGLSDDNIFKEQVERRVNVPVEPEPKPKAPTRPQDPGETGIFDYTDADDTVEGFDAGVLLQGAESAKPGAGSGFGGLDFGAGGDNGDFGTPISGDDFGAGEDDGGMSNGNIFDGGEENMMVPPGDGGRTSGAEQMMSGFLSALPSAEDGARSFGKGFAGLFKKPGGGETPSAQPDIASEGIAEDNENVAPDAPPVDNQETNASDDEFEF